jgi:urea transporter/murein DD-endopeptidase MepM/ murein hydrolase activator NlpD
MLVENQKWFWHSILNSYSQVFFSNNKLFALLLLPVTFLDFYAGLFGLFAVLVTNVSAYLVGFDKFRISQGYLGSNSLLVGLGLGIYFEPGTQLLFIVLVAGILTLFLSVTIEGVVGKYGLPYLSIPFVLSLWALMIASREFQALGLNERGIYTLNDLYIIGGPALVRIYEWWNQLPFISSLKAYFLSLGAIFFQYSVFSGVLIAIGLLNYSKIAFTLSLLGFYTAYIFYLIIGADFSDLNYSYVGFNYILTSIAIGGFFIIPNKSSYLWILLIIPMTVILTISLSSILAVFHLPVYSLPFNVITLLFLYALKFRMNNKAELNTIFVQQNSPEKNLYSFINFMERFGKENPEPIYLPFYGDWTVTQGHEGEYTHKGDWRHAWDFEIKDEEGKSYKDPGDFIEEYYCYNKSIIAPADGVIEEIVDNIEDNRIGERNLEFNWGNTIVIKHTENLYTKLSHLKKGAMHVKRGDKVRKGDLLAKCGNSGNSPYPHLHFQVQATPYIGSKTLEYPFSEFLLKDGGETVLKTVAIPGKNDVVSNIAVNKALRKAFYFIPGEKLKFEIIGIGHKEAIWQVRLDEYLNKFLECKKTKSKAWFRLSDAMLIFTHFEGDRRSLLYFFYLSAYKVSLGFVNGLELKDTFPINLVFNPHRIYLQDFIAPFYRYLKGEYLLTYPKLKNDLFSDDITLTGMVTKKSAGNHRGRLNFYFKIGNDGLQEFEVKSLGTNIKAICIKE